MLVTVLRKNRWIIAIILVAIIITTVLKASASIAAHPDSTFFRDTGLLQASKKVIHLKNALYWQFRTVANASMSSPYQWEAIERRHGNVIGIRKNGNLVYQYFRDNQIFQAEGRLGNIKITNLKGVAQYLNNLKSLQSVISLYENDYLVIWINGNPLNLDLVQRSLALPDFEPPTNIADQTFSKYYWMKFHE